MAEMARADRGARDSRLFVATVVGLFVGGALLGLVASPEGAQEGEERSTAGPAASPRASLAPPCRPGGVASPRSTYGDWNLTILDTRYRLPREYVPPDLVSTGPAGFGAGFAVRAFVLPDLAALARAAAAAGHPIDLVAAYRSFDEQAALYERRKAEMGSSAAKTARPGHSEHQLGTAVDFKTLGASDVTERWGTSPTGTWMASNAHRFGFVMSYPRGRRAATCYPYEPWHFRYLGRHLARRVVASGLTLREYLWSLQRGASPERRPPVR